MGPEETDRYSIWKGNSSEQLLEGTRDLWVSKYFVAALFLKIVWVTGVLVHRSHYTSDKGWTGVGICIQLFGCVTVRCEQLKSTWGKKNRWKWTVWLRVWEELACRAYQDSWCLTDSVALARRTVSRWWWNALRKERKETFIFLSSFLWASEASKNEE